MMKSDFLTVLVASQSKAKPNLPAQQIHRVLSELKVLSQEGEVDAWTRKRESFESTLQELEMDAVRGLEIQVELARQELDLFLLAAKKSLFKAKQQQARAMAAKEQKDEAAARRLMAQSHRLIRESQAWEDRLLVKTA